MLTMTGHSLALLIKYTESFYLIFFYSSDGSQWQLFYHFVGSVPGSTNLEQMLKQMLKQLEVTADSSMPKDQDSAAQLTCSVLSNAKTKPLIVMVDAVNQVLHSVSIPG